MRRLWGSTKSILSLAAAIATVLAFVFLESEAIIYKILGRDVSCWPSLWSIGSSDAAFSSSIFWDFDRGDVRGLKTHEIELKRDKDSKGYEIFMKSAKGTEMVERSMAGIASESRLMPGFQVSVKVRSGVATSIRELERESVAPQFVLALIAVHPKARRAEPSFFDPFEISDDVRIPFQVDFVGSDASVLLDIGDEIFKEESKCLASENRCQIKLLMEPDGQIDLRVNEDVFFEYALERPFPRQELELTRFRFWILGSNVYVDDLYYGPSRQAGLDEWRG